MGWNLAVGTAEWLLPVNSLNGSDSFSGLFTVVTREEVRVVELQYAKHVSVTEIAS